tara:strand:+ start:7857 stop:8819 length:963 start_codon:yes stop_codon:yes gene_type:complete
MDYLIVALLVILSGIFSGLTLGYFSLDLAGLERKVNMGDIYAEKVYPIRKRGNLLLCTLLLGNVAVNSAMAVFLSSIATGLVAGLVSTGLIVVFGEIIPQASFSRHALLVGAKMAWLVRLIILLLYPVTYPISWILDKVLGEEIPTVWGKKELKEIIKQSEDSNKTSVDEDEERIVIGALEFSDKLVADVMVKPPDIFTVNSSDLLGATLLEKIKNVSHSRIPVINENNSIDGVLFVKDLITYSPKTESAVIEIMRKEGFILLDDQLKLDHAMNQFIQSKTVMGLVLDDKNQFIGIISLEDILEEIVQQEISDEDDLHSN